MCVCVYVSICVYVCMYICSIIYCDGKLEYFKYVFTYILKIPKTTLKFLCKIPF